MLSFPDSVVNHSQGTEISRLQEQVKEYERIIASFEVTNEGLRMRREKASPHIVEFCDRHIALNTRTIEAMQSGLEIVRQKLKQAGG